MRQKLEEYGYVCIFCFVPDFKSIKMQVHSLDGFSPPSSTPALRAVYTFYLLCIPRLWPAHAIRIRRHMRQSFGSVSNYCKYLGTRFRNYVWNALFNKSDLCAFKIYERNEKLMSNALKFTFACDAHCAQKPSRLAEIPFAFDKVCSPHTHTWAGWAEMYAMHIQCMCIPLFTRHTGEKCLYALNINIIDDAAFQLAINNFVCSILKTTSYIAYPISN